MPTASPVRNRTGCWIVAVAWEAEVEEQHAIVEHAEWFEVAWLQVVALRAVGDQGSNRWVSRAESGWRETGKKGG
jgi:hypothetical protein